MRPRKFVRPAVAVAAFVAIVLAGVVSSSPRVKAQDDRDDRDDRDSRIQQGFTIAPVPLNLSGKNLALVGLGSYFVNATVPCNECHGAGPANSQYLPGGNPYFGEPKKINPATYLGGGRDFGALVAGSAHIIVIRPQSAAGLDGALGQLAERVGRLQSGFRQQPQEQSLCSGLGAGGPATQGIALRYS
jgi:hypothetical protein